MNPQIEIFIFLVRLSFFATIIEGRSSNLSESYIFNERYTGVEFNPHFETPESPYKPEPSPYPTYTSMNIRTMLEVVSTKFSRVLLRSVDAHDLPYVKNYTYYRGADVRARTAEIAAQLNRERNHTALTVMIGIYYRGTSQQQWNTEIDVALEAARKSQSVSPGTVEGFVIHNTFPDMKDLFEAVTIVRNMSMDLELKIGVQTLCPGRTKPLNQSENKLATIRDLLSITDFIICLSSPMDSEMKGGAKHAFDSIQSEMLAYRSEFRSINSNVDVMWWTWWNEGLKEVVDTRNETQNFHDYWIEVDEFASQYNYTVWLSRAIETSCCMGWWQSPPPDLRNNASGYTETVSVEYDDGGLVTAQCEPNETNTVTETPENSDTKRQFDINFPDDVSSTETPKERSQAWLNGAIFIGAFLVITCIGLVIYIIYNKRRLSKICMLTDKEIDEFKLGISDKRDYEQSEPEYIVNKTALNQPYDRLLEIPKGRLEILTNQILGSGEFGCVFKALMRKESDYEQEVALKTTKPCKGIPALKGLLSEIKILSYIGHHPNIVPIIGAYTAEIHRGTVYVALELCSQGSLKNCLGKLTLSIDDISPEHVNDMIRWSYEIACGMEYLEGKGVIHADLATRNVLLTSDNVAKITDFGLSRRLYEYTNYIKSTQEPLPWRWMAYESLKSMEFSTMSDVWSYGVTLWEIFSIGSQPYPGLSWAVDFLEKLENGLRLSKPKYATSELFDAMEKCWNLNRLKRPKLSELRRKLRNIQTNAVENMYTTVVTC